MQLFDEEAPLGPLRPRDDVLPGILRRGRILRRRRRAVLASPVVASGLVLAVVLALSHSSPLAERVRTAHPGQLQTTVSPSRGGPSGPDQIPTGSVGGTTNSQGHRLTPSAEHSTPSPAARVGATKSKFGPCVPRGYQPPTPPRTCYQSTTGPQGNYVGTDRSARGCVVHNVGGSLAVGPNNEDFFCSYDALKPGGYTTDGPFNLLRITRNGVTIDIDGMDPHTPRCEPAGFIQPGDHVYIDGRNYWGSAPLDPYGYTTMSVGDVFHC